MFATVYRYEGALLNRLSVQAHPVAGELVVHRRGFNRRIAKLLAKYGETYLLPVLDKVSRVDGRVRQLEQGRAQEAPDLHRFPVGAHTLGVER